MIKEDYLKYLREEKTKTLPLFVYPMAASMGYNAFSLTRDPYKHSEVLIKLNKLHDFAFVVGLMDLSLEAEAFGVKLIYDNIHLPKITNPIVRNLSDAENLNIPDYKNTRTNYYVDTIRITKQTIKYKPFLPVVIGPFTLTTILLGMEATKTFVKNNPTVIHTVLAKVSQFLAAYYKALIDAGANGLFICEPSSGFLDEFEFEYLAVKYFNQLVDRLNDNLIIVYHNCGDALKVAEAMKKIHCDIYHFSDYTDITKMLEILPKRKLVMGNLSPIEVFQKQKAIKIESSTIKLLKKTKNNGNFIIAPGCDVPHSVNLSSIVLYLDGINSFYRKLKKKKK